MNLLEATSTLLDFVKTNAPENDKTIQRAIKRMEKRLTVLQARRAKNLKRIQMEAFFDARTITIAAVIGGVAMMQCTKCLEIIEFDDFVRTAEYTGRGRFLSVTCPWCRFLMQKEVA